MRIPNPPETDRVGAGQALSFHHRWDRINPYRVTTLAIAWHRINPSAARANHANHSAKGSASASGRTKTRIVAAGKKTNQSTLLRRRAAAVLKQANTEPVVTPVQIGVQLLFSCLQIKASTGSQLALGWRPVNGSALPQSIQIQRLAIAITTMLFLASKIVDAAIALDHHAIQVIRCLDQGAANCLSGRGLFLMRQIAAEATTI